MNKFEERTRAKAIGRGLGPLAALTLVAIETVCLEWEAGRNQAGAGLLRAWHRSGKGYLGALTTVCYVWKVLSCLPQLLL